MNPKRRRRRKRKKVKKKRAKKQNSLAVYENFRPRMKNGDVIAFQGRDTGAKLIQKFTKSDYSHVGLVIRIKELGVDRVFILESVTKAGVVLLPLSRKLKRYKGKAWWLPLKLKTAQAAKEKRIRTKVYRWSMDELGKEYDFKMIRSIMKKVLGRKKKNPAENDDEYICSELVARAFKEANILPKNKTTSNITPRDITGLKILGKPRELI